ncbi:hypothetical protein D3C78_1649960 [compost metagenome]
MPVAAVAVLDLQVDGDLAEIMQQRSISRGGGPGFRLHDLILGGGPGGQQIRLPQFERIRDDFQAVVQHAAGVGVVVVLGGRQVLDQLGIAFQRR